MSALPGSPEGTATTGLDATPVDSSPETLADLPPLTEQTRIEAREIMARYPVARSALLPMLHLVQSYQGYVSPEGVALCAEELGLTKAEVGAVATFYTMYKRRPAGRHLVSVCTNTLCNVLGGQRIYEALSADLGVHHDETTADGSITLEHAECLAACDYAPVVTVDYEFYDQQDVDSARELVAALRRGEKPLPTRGAPLTDFRGISRQLAGFSQHADAAAARAAVDAPGDYGPTLRGLHLADERGETAPAMPRRRQPEPTPDRGEPRATTRPTGGTGETPQKEAADASVAAADTPAEKAGTAEAHADAPEPKRRRPLRRRATSSGTTSSGTTSSGAGNEPAAGYQDPDDAGSNAPSTERED
jgi:NADH-quinone oxidoreductase subunit E